MFYFVQHIFLRHKLRKLVSGEELFDASLKGALIYYLYRHRSIDVNGRHPILYISLNLHHAGTDLLLEHLSHKAHAALS